jgi:hypothetical protein
MAGVQGRAGRNRLGVIVQVDMTVVPPDVRLDDDADFRSFHVEVRGSAESQQLDRTLNGSGVGRLEGDHAVVAPEALRRLAGDAVSTEWIKGLESMTSYARSKGWLDDSGWIRAHIEEVAEG